MSKPRNAGEYLPCGCALCVDHEAAFEAMREALRLTLKRGQAWKPSMNDFTAWHKASAVDIGEVLNAIRAALALADEVWR